jgi:hypothetical protein
MRRVVVAAVGLLAMLGARPSWGGGVEPVRLPDGSALPAVEFDRHVASLFGRLGCNAGSCHGSFQGRGGLSLSLFGASLLQAKETSEEELRGLERVIATARRQKGSRGEGKKGGE